MNRSVVITRYARALVKYVRETGGGDTVCSEAKQLVVLLHDVPDLRRMMEAASDVVTAFEKKKLLQTALGNKMSPELSRFLTLLNTHRRMDLVEDILRDFVLFYQQSMGVRQVQLIAAREPSLHLLDRLRQLLRQKTGNEVIFDVTVDPSLVGGFIVDMGNNLLDASVRRQLSLIREQFVEQNRRIV